MHLHASHHTHHIGHRMGIFDKPPQLEMYAVDTHLENHPLVKAHHAAGPHKPTAAQQRRREAMHRRIKKRREKSRAQAAAAHGKLKGANSAVKHLRPKRHRL